MPSPPVSGPRRGNMPSPLCWVDTIFQRIPVKAVKRVRYFPSREWSALNPLPSEPAATFGTWVE
eukprot:2883084-Pyramimonas_sp.AAC.1